MNVQSWGRLRRVGILLSAVWLCVAYAVSNGNSGAFVEVAVLPLALVWGVAWVMQGVASGSKSKRTADGPVASGLKRSRTKTIDVAFVCIALAGLALIYFGVARLSDENRAAFAVGRLTGSFVVIAGIAYLIASGRSARASIVIYLVAGAAMICFTGETFKDENGAVTQGDGVRTAASRLADTLQDGIDKEANFDSKSLSGKAAAPRPIESSVPGEPPVPHQTNDGKLRGAALLAAAEPIVRDLQESSLERQGYYDRKLQELHLEHILAPATLASPSSADSSRKTISTMVRLLRQSQEEDERTLAEFGRRMRAVDMASDERVAFEKTYGDSLAKTRTLRRDFYAIEQQLASTLRDLVVMLQYVVTVHSD